MSNAQIPLISVIVLNYNGLSWLERCVDSLAAQNRAADIEIIVADNCSTDGSDRLAESLVNRLSNARFIKHPENLGFCEGNNRAAAGAKGTYLFFLNNDAWLESDCLEILVREVQRCGAVAATPLVLNYDSDEFQSLGCRGFDIFGFPTDRRPFFNTREVLMPEGCSYLILRKVFEALGGFDSTFFMYADEYDLSWRLWIAGFEAIGVPKARCHHRGAANVNPAGGAKQVEFRTSDTKRFYANRNTLLVLLKCSQNILFFIVLLQILFLTIEAAAGLLIIRRWTFIRNAYIRAFTDCFRLRHHIKSQRDKVAASRRRSDLSMLRFLSWRLNRFDEIKRVLVFGLPKVMPR